MLKPKIKILKKAEMDSRLQLTSRLDLDETVRSGFFFPDKLVLSEDDLKSYEQGSSLIAQAAREAAAIKQRAKALLAEVEARVKEARAKGYQDGRTEGLQSVSEMQARMVMQNAKIAESLEKDMIRLVFEIAQKILGDAFKESDEAVLGLIRQAMQASLGSKLLILVNAADFERLKHKESQLLASLHAGQTLQIKPSETVPINSCVIESELGTVEAHLDVQLEAIKKALGL